MLQILIKLPHSSRLRLALVTTLTIAGVCLMPGDEFPQMEIPFLDKFIHLTMFAAFGFTWRLRFYTGTSAVVTIITGGILYSLILEVLQDQIATARSFEVADIFANILGSLLGIWVFHLMNRTGTKNFVE